jgi:hypothetical protein
MLKYFNIGFGDDVSLIFYWIYLKNSFGGTDQGCQIFLVTTNQKGRKYIKIAIQYQMAIKYAHQNGNKDTKLPLNTYTKILYPFKIYQNWPFWYENIPSGNPGTDKLGLYSYQGKSSHGNIGIKKSWRGFEPTIKPVKLICRYAMEIRQQKNR